MGYCKRCGSLVSDVALFCAKCGEPVEREELVSSQGFAPLDGPPPQLIDNGAYPPVQPLGRDVNARSVSSSVGNDSLGLVQGGLACLVVLIGLFAPIIQTGSMVGGSTGSSFSLSMPVIISLVMQGGDMIISSLGSLGGVGQVKDALGLVVIWIIVLSVLGLVGLVGAFMTAARRFEGTSKETIVTGWLMVPYALGIIVTLFIVVGAIDGIVGSFTNGRGAGTIVQMTLWPWVMLLASVACGVLGVVRSVQGSKTQQMTMY